MPNLNDMWSDALRMEGGKHALTVDSMQNKWRDSFTTTSLTANWDVTSYGTGATASSSAGVLTLASGTTAGAATEMLSKQTFTIPLRAMAGVQTGSRVTNTHEYVALVSVDPATGLPDGRHSIAIDVGGSASTTVTQGIYEVQNGGLRPLASAASTIVTTNTYAILELEPFADETYFHSRSIDATTGRANSYVRHQQIPDPNATYKLLIRQMNHAAWKDIAGAVAGTGNVIRVTSTAHGYSTSNVVWVESLNGVTNNGARVYGNYTITVVDTNTFELQGTTFAGTYVTGSGRCALAAAPASSHSFQFQFVNTQDYAELTAEITAGRGQAVVGQSLGVTLVGSTNAATTAIGQVIAAGPVAHDGARGSTAPVITAGRALSAAYTTVATGDVADFITTLQGVLVTRPWQIPELEWSYAAASGGVINTTDVVLAAAAGAGLRRYITSMTLSNANATVTEVVLKDGATVIWRGHLGANAVNVQIRFENPLRTTANTALNFACITTAAAVYVNAQGFTAA